MRKFFNLFSAQSTPANVQLSKLLGGPWPAIAPSDLGVNLSNDFLSQFPLIKIDAQYKIYQIKFNSWHLDFEKTVLHKKICYQLKLIPGYLLVPTDDSPHYGLIARHQSGWKYSRGAKEVMGLAGDDEEELQNLVAFAIKHRCVMICTDSPGYADYFPTTNQQPTERAQIESCYDRILRSYGKCYLWQIINDIQANIAFLDVLASQDIVQANQYFGIGHSMGGQQLLCTAPFVNRLTTIFVNDGFTSIQYLATHFPAVLHGPSLMVPDIIFSGDNQLIFQALIEKKIIAYLAFGQSDSGNPPQVAIRMLESAKKYRHTNSLEILIHPGAHQLTTETMQWFSENFDVRRDKTPSIRAKL